MKERWCVLINAQFKKKETASITSDSSIKETNSRLFVYKLIVYNILAVSFSTIEPNMHLAF